MEHAVPCALLEMSATPGGIAVTHGAIDPLLLSTYGFCARVRRRNKSADRALMVYFLAWQALSALSQSLEHSLRR